ncbi:MAG: DUF1631 family protein [Burkholderiaceae bacterium]
MQDIAWPDREFDLLIASDGGVSHAQADVNEDANRNVVTNRPGLFDALAPLMTDVQSVNERQWDRRRARTPDADFLSSFALPESDGRRENVLRDGDLSRRALARAIAELAETHAVAADLACRQAAIDLPLDVPDPVFDAFAESIALAEGRPIRKPMLIVPDVIRTCRDRLAAYIDAADRTKLDIVASLFDQVLADDRLPTEIRNTLARLQLPVLRMALADDSFFASRTHPSRRLLDRLAASSHTAAVEWKLDSDSGRAWRDELERVVYAVIRGSSDDASEHARLLEEFENRLVEIAATATQTLTLAPDQEDRDVLVIKATIQISQLLAGLEVDRTVRFFLLDVWSRVLGEIVWGGADHSSGRSSESARNARRDATEARAKRLCVDLAWSTAPKTTSGERGRLAGLLPTMIEALRDGLAMIDYPKAEQDRFFTDWARLLYLAVKRPSGAGDFNRPFRLAGSDAHDGRDSLHLGALDIDDFARRLREGSFGPEIPRADTRGAGAPTEARGLRTAEEATPSMLADAARKAIDAPPAAPMPTIADLHKGEWFELREPRGFVRVRLSWISPLKSFYLFIGADSALTRSFDPGVLTDLLARGELRYLPKDGERRK